MKKAEIKEQMIKMFESLIAKNDCYSIESMSGYANGFCSIIDLLVENKYMSDDDDDYDEDIMDSLIDEFTVVMAEAQISDKPVYIDDPKDPEDSFIVDMDVFKQVVENFKTYSDDKLSDLLKRKDLKELFF